MYLGGGFTYYAGTEQRHTRAPFLILASRSPEALYACVRKVALGQFGHFMMGRANIGGSWVTVSGAYGNDGLPMNYDKLTDRQRAAFVAVPEEIAAIYWEGGGHNNAGSEAGVMRKYGRKLAHPSGESFWTYEVKE